MLFLCNMEGEWFWNDKFESFYDVEENGRAERSSRYYYKIGYIL